MNHCQETNTNNPLCRTQAEIEEANNKIAIHHAQNSEHPNNLKKRSIKSYNSSNSVTPSHINKNRDYHSQKNVNQTERFHNNYENGALYKTNTGNKPDYSIQKHQTEYDNLSQAISRRTENDRNRGRSALALYNNMPGTHEYPNNTKVIQPLQLKAIQYENSTPILEVANTLAPETGKVLLHYEFITYLYELVYHNPRFFGT